MSAVSTLLSPTVIQNSGYWAFSSNGTDAQCIPYNNTPCSQSVHYRVLKLFMTDIIELLLKSLPIIGLC